jgi:LysM repeat protein
MIKFIFIGFSIFSSPAPQDSLGVETINGKVFVIHKVDEKETLYSISRRYGATVDAIKQFNASAATSLEIGTILKVPYTPKQVKTVANPGPSGTTHKVAQKETLYSIARTYGVSMEDLKKWNNLTDNSLTIGKELIVKKQTTGTTQPVQKESNTVAVKGTTHTVGEKETMYGIARQYGITVDQLRQWNDLQGVELKIGQVLKVTSDEQPVKKEVAEVKTNNSTTSTNNTVSANTTKTNQQTTVTQPEKKEPVPVKTETPVIQEPIKISEAVKNSDEVIEAGVAELIEGTEGNRKYLALHRTAPVGTILKVRNEMNNREVFVRVMGKLPDTAMTDKLIIKVSKSAYDRLGAIDPKFRVQVTYYK